jgi:hypothetical protein
VPGSARAKPLRRTEELVIVGRRVTMRPPGLDMPSRLADLARRRTEPDGNRAASSRRPAQRQRSTGSLGDAARDVEAEAGGSGARQAAPGRIRMRESLAAIGDHDPGAPGGARGGADGKRRAIRACARRRSRAGCPRTRLCAVGMAPIARSDRLRLAALPDCAPVVIALVRGVQTVALPAVGRQTGIALANAWPTRPAYGRGTVSGRSRSDSSIASPGVGTVAPGSTGSGRRCTSSASACRGAFITSSGSTHERPLQSGSCGADLVGLCTRRFTF